MGNSKRSPALALLVTILMLTGLGATLLCLMAAVGTMVGLFWVRLASAVVLALAIPATIADRLLPESGPKPKGLVTKVFAVLWIAFPLLFLLAAGGKTKALMVAEGDRLMAEGFGKVSALSHLLAGERPPAPKPNGSSPGANLAASAKQPVAGSASAAKSNASAKARDKTTATAQGSKKPPSFARGSKRNDCTYPSGPYGTAVGDTLPPNFQWAGFAPGSNAATTVVPRDLFDCNGKGGIRAVVIDVSRYG